MDNFDRGRVYTYIGEDSAAVDELRAAIALNPGFALRSGLRTAYGYQCAYDDVGNLVRCAPDSGRDSRTGYFWGGTDPNHLIA